VAARGWAADCEVGFRLAGATGAERPDGGGTDGSLGWRLVVRDGVGALEPSTDPELPSLHVRGLALLWAGVATTAQVRRAGLLDGPLPGLDAACAGPVPDLLDDF